MDLIKTYIKQDLDLCMFVLSFRALAPLMANIQQSQKSEQVLNWNAGTKPITISLQGAPPIFFFSKSFMKLH